AARNVHGIGRRLVDQVDDELAGAPDVLQRMLHGAVAARIDADHAERRVFRKHVEEREGRAIRHAVFAPGRDPRDRTRDDEADQQLVALVRRNVGEVQVHQPARVKTCRSREASSGTASARYFLKCAVWWCASKLNMVRLRFAAMSMSALVQITSSSSVWDLTAISPVGATITECPNMRKPSSKPHFAVSTSQVAFWNAIACAMMRWWCTRSAGGSG